MKFTKIGHTYDYQPLGHATTYYKVAKPMARHLSNCGLTIILCPSRFHPFGGWLPSMELPADHSVVKEKGFDTAILYFEQYNCINSETGHKAAYYVKASDILSYQKLEMLVSAL